MSHHTDTLCLSTGWYVEKTRERIRRNSSIDLRTGCWNWNKARVNIYGIMGYAGKTYFAHRVAFLVFKEVEPGDQIVYHLCNNSLCVNPEHLGLKDRESSNRAPDDVVKRVRTMLASRTKYFAISKDCGISTSTVSRIKKEFTIEKTQID